MAIMYYQTRAREMMASRGSKNRLLLFLSFQHASFIKITNKISFDKYHLK